MLLIGLAVVVLGIIIFLVYTNSITPVPLIQEGIATSDAPQTVYDYNYKGCWNGSPGPTGSNGSSNPLPYHISGTYDISGCVIAGVSRNYKTVGLMNSNECWAGNHNADYLINDYKANGPVDTSANPDACNISNPGPTSMMVYSNLNETVSTPIGGYRYGGCWTDSTTSPSLPMHLNTSGPTGATGTFSQMTLTQCVDAGKSKNYNSVAYMANGQCYGGNQGSAGIDYKKGGEIPNNNRRCDVGGPGPNTSIVYTTYGSAHTPTISGYDYKGCWKDGSPSFTSRLLGNGYTLDKCVEDSKKLGYDLISFQNENQCKGGTQNKGSDYMQYGRVSDDDPSCNSYYPVNNTSVVYSTVTPQPRPTNDYLEKALKWIHSGGRSGGDGDGTVMPSNIDGYAFKGFWNESADRTVQNYIGSYSLEECIQVAKSKGYGTVSFQSANQCWAGTNSNYKKYGQSTASSIRNPSTTVAAIYSTGAEPSSYVSCGAHVEGIESMDSSTTTTTSTPHTPQPPYTVPQTTTVSFESTPKTNTIITYSQTPIGTSGISTNAAPVSSSSSKDSTQLQSTSNMSQDDKSNVHRQWLPNTPFVYENKNTTTTATATATSSPASTQNSSTMSPSPLSTSTSTMASAFSKSDIINNIYNSASNSENTGLELFTTINQKDANYYKKQLKEGIESLSPPPQESPSGPFIPKSMVVPPVCPSIPPVVIKTDCSVCNKNAAKDATSSKQAQSTALTNQMTSNFANSNSITSSTAGNPYSTASYFDNTHPINSSSCKNQGRTYDNIPQPYLPSFSGFGM